MGSLIAFSAYVYTLQHARPALVSSYAFVNPIVAIVIGYLLLDEVVSIISIIAMMIILLGVVFITLGKRST
jgi:drug/metabolite transporter (DMT)-like permease